MKNDHIRRSKSTDGRTPEDVRIEGVFDLHLFSIIFNLIFSK